MAPGVFRVVWPRTLTILRRYQAEARISEIGWQARPAATAASSTASSVQGTPAIDGSAFQGSHGKTGATAPKASLCSRGRYFRFFLRHGHIGDCDSIAFADPNSDKRFLRSLHEWEFQISLTISPAENCFAWPHKKIIDITDFRPWIPKFTVASKTNKGTSRFRRGRALQRFPPVVALFLSGSSQAGHRHCENRKLCTDQPDL